MVALQTIKIVALSTYKIGDKKKSGIDIEAFMKISILTFSFAVNRGAHMQCYALQTVLLNAGHNVEIIHIELPSGRLSWKGKLDQYILNSKNERFRKKHYSKITLTYHSAEELRQNPPIADVYIVGSDQVWNPALTQAFGSEAFFLDFVPKGCKKIAYAASFGASVWISLGADKDAQIRKFVSLFDAISVRETDGVKICNQVFGRNDAVSVIDPVFLLDDYSQIVGECNKVQKQVICYPLFMNDATREVFSEVSCDLKLTPISYTPSLCGGEIKVRMFSSIPVWLKAIKQSEIVVTNSFHCMAFCILFHKRFIVTPPVPGRESRILSMLSQLGIEDRYVKSTSDYQMRKTILYKDIDYTTVDERLRLLRQESTDFLLRSL